MKRESLRKGETEKERSRVREFERKRESWEQGETPVGVERRSGELVTQRPNLPWIDNRRSQKPIFDDLDFQSAV
jgi:hypothetical protein